MRREPVENLPDEWTALTLLVFTLGVKHGLDADHLATIDGLTRFNARRNRRLARWCGALFSLGHGGVVLAIALAVGAAAQRWIVPEWMNALGALISIGFLVALGVMNLVAVLAARPGELVQPVALKGRLLAGMQRTGNPVAIALVGAFFALSFDTMSQAALFAATGTQFGGPTHSALLGLLFMLGMMLTDGLNGLWISRLIRRADRLGYIASRVMGLTIAGLSLAIAGVGAARAASPRVSAWLDGRELAFGAGFLMAVALSFVFAVRRARTRTGERSSG